MKKIVSVVVMVSFLFFLIACSSPAAPANTIEVMGKTSDNSFEANSDTSNQYEEECAIKLANYIQESPLKINSYYMASYDTLGDPEISVNADNTSGKTIDGFKVLFFCYSNFNEPAYNKFRTDEELGYVESAIYNGKIVNTFRWSDGYWTLYNYDTASRVIPIIYAVHFADNTTWEIPEEYLTGAEILAQEIVNAVDWNA